jgi:hypothetical protein
LTPRLVFAFILLAVLSVVAEEKDRPGGSGPIDTLRVPIVDFIAEQVGPFEQQIKEALLPVLKRHPDIRRAYLVAVLYDRKQKSVALCLESQAGPNERVVKEVSEVFKEKGGRDLYLDIIFLSDEQRTRVKNVAQAFYVAS